jgi:glyoxylate/hydroxypyruvate reductase A
MAVIALHLPPTLPQAWLDTLIEGLKDHSLRKWPDQIAAPDEVEYVITLRPEPGSLNKYARLKAIFSTAAGVDHLLVDESFPRNVPLCRLTHPELASRMSEYVLLHVLRIHRQCSAYRDQQAGKVWKPLAQKGAQESTVGIMGLGVLGLDAARKLRSIGFKVCGWSRTPRAEEGIVCFHGAAQLEDFLKQAEYLVCFLPLTAETRGILNKRSLGLLPRGAAVINVGRGKCISEQDLLEALATGSVGEAVLDVFDREPLPAESPLWTHPKVTITPHVSTTTHPKMLVETIRENIARIESGRAPLNVVDPTRGY